MKIKLDENLPHGLAMELEKLGHDVRTAVQENLQGSTDNVIWEAVQKESRFFDPRYGFFRYSPLCTGGTLWDFTGPFTPAQSSESVGAYSGHLPERGSRSVGPMFRHCDREENSRSKTLSV
jgi:Domain of unknown function (DUF5615)